MPDTRRSPGATRGQPLPAEKYLTGLAELLAERPDLHGIGLAPLGTAVLNAEPNAWTGRAS